MRIGAFKIHDPAPQLNDPHALVIVKPWIDVGNSATLALTRLESYLGAKPLGEVTQPGNYFDFTRYRPMMEIKDGTRRIQIPNTTLTYAIRPGKHDFIFMYLMEPHMQAEKYINSAFEVLREFGVKRYCHVGSMYDLVPYTRPLLITGSASNLKVQRELDMAQVAPSDYQGPTTITYLITEMAERTGMETLSMIVHLPQYLTMENDYRGKKKLMEALSILYDFPLAEEDTEKTIEQQEQVVQMAEEYMEKDPKFKGALSQLESFYDSRLKPVREEKISLPPEVEDFLRNLGKRFEQEE